MDFYEVITIPKIICLEDKLVNLGGRSVISRGSRVKRELKVKTDSVTKELCSTSITWIDYG